MVLSRCIAGSGQCCVMMMRAGFEKGLVHRGMGTLHSQLNGSFSPDLPAVYSAPCWLPRACLASLHANCSSLVPLFTRFCNYDVLARGSKVRQQQICMGARESLQPSSGMRAV
jgi:hypothetical protein